MSDLGMLALQRANLQDFPGASYQEKLEAGRQAALAVLQKYQPDLAFDANAADQAVRTVGVWIDRNGERLQAAFADHSLETLTNDIALELSNQTAWAYVVACYTYAAQGLGPWRTDLISQLSAAWAESDAETRLQVFAAIVQMDQDGTLASLFNAQGGTQGFGSYRGLGLAPAVLVAIVIAVIAVAGILAVLYYNLQRLDAANRMMANLCAQAQAQGNQAQVQACVDAAAGLQAMGPFDTISKGVSVTMALVGLAVVAYVGIELVGPMLKPKGASA